MVMVGKPEIDAPGSLNYVIVWRIEGGRSFENSWRKTKTKI
jgi:hypothetical protein